ncbi:MAG: hypothetical protein AB1758_12920 [Candidatus Eremiobacterota bacterium]
MNASALATVTQAAVPSALAAYAPEAVASGSPTTAPRATPTALRANKELLSWWKEVAAPVPGEVAAASKPVAASAGASLGASAVIGSAVGKTGVLASAAASVGSVARKPTGDGRAPVRPGEAAQVGTAAPPGEGAEVATGAPVTEPVEPDPTVENLAEAQDIFDDVLQGEASNCGALSVVKAMLLQWGGDAMKRERLEDGSIRVTMRDGWTTVLTREELQQAREAAGIRGGDDWSDQQLTFVMLAAASKRYAEERSTSDKPVTYQDALAKINGNNFPDEVARYFGVAAVLRETDGNDAAIVCNGTHSAVVVRSDDGVVYQDDHGNAVVFDGNVYSNGENTGEAAYAFDIVDVDQVDPNDPEQSLSIGERIRRALAGERPGEGAELGEGGAPPDPAQVVVSAPVEDALEVVSDASPETRAADYQSEQTAEAQSEVQESVASAQECQSAAEEAYQEADQAEADQEYHEAQVEVRLEQLEDRLESTRVQLAVCQGQLEDIHSRVGEMRETLTEVEGERNRLAGEDYLQYYEEVDRLDLLGAGLRRSIAAEEEAARKLHQEIARLSRQAAETEHSQEEISTERSQSRSDFLARQSQWEERAEGLEREAGRQRNGAAQAAGQGLWHLLSDPDSEAAWDARERANELRERDREAAGKILDNRNFLLGYGVLDLESGSGSTLVERSLGRMQRAMSYVDPNGGQHSGPSWGSGAAHAIPGAGRDQGHGGAGSAAQGHESNRSGGGAP